MKKILVDLLLIVLIITVSGELISTGFKLYSDDINIIEEDSKGFTTLKKNSEGYFRFGQFPTFYEKKFHINDIGYNSLLDFNNIDYSRFNIALIGDSFIQSKHTNIENSIGSRLMEINNKIQCFEFGKEGYTAIDMLNVYNEFNLQKFDMVIFFISKDDLTSKTGKRPFNKNLNKIRNVYNISNFSQYLNNTFSLTKKIRNIFVKNQLENKYVYNYDSIRNVFNDLKNSYLISKLQNEESFFISEKFKNVIKIKHELTPINFGFDQHWNNNGRTNVVNSIKSCLNIESIDDFK
ncbi:hypothetical protein N8374_00090 [Flavobacteriaceae bacterium]|nr:hypothetical protein [Flavobacteriaceae bacterium]